MQYLELYKPQLVHPSPSTILVLPLLWQESWGSPQVGLTLVISTIYPRLLPSPVALSSPLVLPTSAQLTTSPRLLLWPWGPRTLSTTLAQLLLLLDLSDLPQAPRILDT